MNRCQIQIKQEQLQETQEMGKSIFLTFQHFLNNEEEYRWDYFIEENRI